MRNILLKTKRILMSDPLYFKNHINMIYESCHKMSVMTNYSKKQFKRFNSLKESPSNQFFTWNIVQQNRRYRSRFGNYSVIKKPSDVLDSSPVPSHIVKPPYAETGLPCTAPLSPEIKNEKQIKGMIEACRRARDVLNTVEQNIKVGLTTEDIDIIVRERSFENDCYPSPLNYRSFPKSCCTSVNNIACHGIPDTRALEDGDIISVDVTVYYKGFHGDCCETFLVGNVDDAGKHLIKIAKDCRDAAIKICGPEVPYSDIGTEIERLAREERLTVAPAFLGHGIGQYFHGPPEIYHHSNDKPGVMAPGMTFTIEPVLTQGSREAMILEDGWTVAMLDNARAAQFEHTILITDNGQEILTH